VKTPVTTGAITDGARSNGTGYGSHGSDWAHDRSTCRTCVLWWVPLWDPWAERVDPWLNRVDYRGFYREAA
jgi:hypothetical protein